MPAAASPACSTADRSASASSWLENLKSLSRYRRGFEIAGGLTLIVMGLYMLNAVLF